jgi:hypothetical protein
VRSFTIQVLRKSLSKVEYSPAFLVVIMLDEHAASTLCYVTYFPRIEIISILFFPKWNLNLIVKKILIEHWLSFSFDSFLFPHGNAVCTYHGNVVVTIPNCVN